MAQQDIEFAVEDGVAVITLNRPAERNAFSGRMGVELGEAYARCDVDDDVRAVVLTGAGRDFCVGADFSFGADLFQKGAVAFYTCGGASCPTPTRTGPCRAQSASPAPPNSSSPADT